MADIDILPKRAIPAAALVDSTGIASNGSSTVAQLARRGMASICAVDGTGTSILGATLAQIARCGIQTFCPVDENGLAQDSSTADQLRKRGISPMVLLDANGIALTGSSSMQVLARRGLGYFCPVDESGNATTMGAIILISNSTVVDNATVGTNVGTLSVAGGTGTYTFTLTSNPGGLFATAGTNGVNLNTAAALTAGTYPITVQAAGGVPTPLSRTMNIIVTARIPANTVLPVISGTTTVGSTLTTTDGTWSGTSPITFTYQWLRNGLNISGASSNSYLIVTGDAGSMISVVVTASNAAGGVNATAAAVGPVIAPVSVGAIVLTWTSSPTDNTPNYSLALPVDALVGDIVILEEADNSGFAFTTSDSTSIGSSTANPILMESVLVVDGTWYARARIQRGAGYGPYSNVVTVTVDTTAPTITSSASFSQVEAVAFSTTLTASETVTWSKTGGADAALYTLSGATLSMTAKTFASPIDADANNTYLVQVTATDAVGNATNQTITVTITAAPTGRTGFVIASQYVNTTAPRSYITAAGYLVET